MICSITHPNYIYFVWQITAFLLLLTSGGTLLFAREYSGVVLDQDGNPVSQATVKLQGTEYTQKSNRDGSFKIRTQKPILPKYITAWKMGFYNGGQTISNEDHQYRITLAPIRLDDNKNYKWLPSTKQIIDQNKTEFTGENQPCQACHPEIVKEWQKDAHSGSAKNPVFLTFFNGTNLSGQKDKGPGYKLDFKNSNGNCTTCHVPAMALKNPFNSNPNNAKGVETEGVFCDLCHKIEGVKVDETGGFPGVLSYKFKRPFDDHQIFYGPYDDVYPGEDSYHPLYSKSHYCAPCHHGKFWDVLVYSEFQEWLDSSYFKRNIHCQSCHMKPENKLNRFALEKEGGIKRDPSTVPSHVNFGVNDEAFMKAAISLETTTDIVDGFLKVSVTIQNTNAGHHYPTGNPMRNMILLVDVTDQQGQSLKMIAGEKVPLWGGVGLKEDGNYAGLPGKGFAKVLKDRILYSGGKQKRDFQPEYPAPHWRPVTIESDTRIPADGTDLSTYKFKLPTSLKAIIKIKISLIFRRTYKKWSDAKGLQLKDMEIARSQIIIRR